ncbi:hypothetical protein C8R44DRAFT_731912 [Mycena epipterygia]|nr:hypothetical protein C8R44DRAFT_731912 [Mycena epipterygia]
MPTSSPQPVPDLWFKDASLVFQAEGSLFRVYSGILAARSSVFRDMLAFPQPEPSPSDVLDGCPKIFLHDTASDVTAFFRAIFDSSFFVPPFVPPLDTLSGILRLSIKYDVDYLRQRCLHHLSDIYPTTLKDWDLLGYSRDIINFRAPPKVYPVFQVLQLLREIDAPWLVPAIMYLGCSNPIQRIRCAACTAPAECNAALLQLSRWVAEDWAACRFPLEIWEDQDWDEVTGELCHACVAQCRKMHAKARQEFWDRMPGIFGVDRGWDELERVKRSALSG